MKTYTPEEIYTLAKAVDGHTNSYDWLKNNNCLELAAVCCGLVNYDSSKSLDWLHKYNFRVLWSFIDSFDDNNNAFEYLLHCSGKEWGATVCASYGDEKAIKWLVQFGYKHYVLLAKAIYELIERNDRRRDRGRFMGGGLFGGSSDADSGFGGFDGGSFGGGGAGGSW